MYETSFRIKGKLTVDYIKDYTLLSTSTQHKYNSFKRNLSLIFGILLLIIAFFSQIIKSYIHGQVYFDIGLSNLVILFIVIILSIILNLILFHIIKRPRSQDNISNSLKVYRELESITDAVGSLLVIATLPLFSNPQFIEIGIFYLIFFGIFLLFIFYIYGHGKIISKIYLSSNPLNIQTQEIIPLPFAHIIINHQWESFNGNIMHLAILIHEKSSRQIRSRLKGKVLFGYNFLTLKDVESFANEAKTFNIYITGKKLESYLEFGSLFATKITFNELMTLINYLRLYTPIEVIKPQNMSESEFITKVVKPKAIKHKRKINKYLSLSFLLILVLIMDIFLVFLIFISIVVIFDPTASLPLYFKGFFLVFLVFEISALIIPPAFILRVKKIAQ